MLSKLRSAGWRRLVAAVMVAATASLSFPFACFAHRDDRYSYSDVYDNEASQGSKGQVYKAYSSAHCSFDDYNTGTWKEDIAPASGAIHAAQFAYDSKGRVTDVYKLQKVVTGTPTYVRTQSLYGSDGSPAYGNAVEVVEDHGGIDANPFSSDSQRTLQPASADSAPSTSVVTSETTFSR